jgi:hypothetical protein
MITTQDRRAARKVAAFAANALRAVRDDLEDPAIITRAQINATWMQEAHGAIRALEDYITTGNANALEGITKP